MKMRKENIDLIHVSMIKFFNSMFQYGVYVTKYKTSTMRFYIYQFLPQ